MTQPNPALVESRTSAPEQPIAEADLAAFAHPLPSQTQPLPAPPPVDVVTTAEYNRMVIDLANGREPRATTLYARKLVARLKEDLAALPPNTAFDVAPDLV